MKTYRASSLPLLMRCPAAQLDPKVRIVEPSPQADDGKAAHECLEGLPRDGRVDWDALPGIVERHGADETQVRILVSNGTKLWVELRSHFSAGETERELSLEFELDGKSMRITGHTDVTSIRVEGSWFAARTLDWKSGRLDADYSWQMQAYNALLLHSSDGIAEATATIGWLRELDAESYTMNKEGLWPWLTKVHKRLAQWDGMAHYPGTHCSYCSRSHECDARTSMVRESAAVVHGFDLERGLERMTPDEIIGLRAKAAEVERLAKRLRDAISCHVRERGDIVGTTHRLTTQTTSRRSIDTARAWPILEDAGFGDEELCRCVEIHPSAVDEIVKERAPKRCGAKAIREINARLDEAGALTKSESTKVVERRL